MLNYTKLIWTLLVVAACVLPALTQDDLGANPAAGAGSAAGSAVEGASDGHLGESQSNSDQKNNSSEVSAPLGGAPDANQEGGSGASNGGSGAGLGGADSNHDDSDEDDSGSWEGSHELSGSNNPGSNPVGGGGELTEGSSGGELTEGGEHAEGGDGSDLDDAQVVVSNVPTFDAEGRFTDVTDFVVGVNDWNFHGWWAKFNTSEKSVMDIPLNEESKNHMTFICKVKEYESFLEKKFPALEDARIIISYYFSSPAEDLVMKLTMEQAGRPPLGIFTYTFPEDLLEHHEVWVSQEVQIPSYSRIQPFKIKLSLSSFNSSTWAADELRVLGSAPTSQPLVNFTYPPLTSEEPEVNETSPSVLTNHTLPPVNVTSPPSVNASLSSNSSGDGTNQTSSGPGEEGKTEDSNVTANITPAPSSGDPDFSEHLGRLESVAQAIWDAFYVFLALFCACLVALVALIVRGRCREDDPPPAVATYNPRTASYRLDKVYDNPSYDNNAV